MTILGENGLGGEESSEFSSESSLPPSLGRISGKLLSANLIRNGVDLYFKNSDVADALLHLDVSGMRIGINTDPSAPIYTVDVNSDILTKNAEATGNLYVDEFSISSSATISTLSDIIISPAGPGAQSLFNAWGSQSIVFDENQLYSISNNDIVFTPDGTGTVELEASTNITGSLYVTGTINLDGDLSTIENITVGNDDTDDLLTFLAKFTSDLTPDSDISFDLGDGDFRWNDFYSDNIIAGSNISTGNISLSSPATIESISGDLIFSLSGGDKFTSFTNGLSTPNFLIQHNRIKSDINEDLQLEASGTGKVTLNNDTDFLGNLSIFGFIQMGGDLSTTSNIIIGDQPTDVVTFNTDLNQDILPKTTLTYDLGKSDFRWQNAYIDDWRYITNINTDSAVVDGKMLLGGNNNILALTGNDNLILNPASGINIIEELKFEDFLPTAIPSENLIYTIDNPNAYGTGDGDQFGYAVDASTSYFIVGAFAEDDAGGTQSGKAYIYSTYTGSLLYTLDNPNPFGTSQDDRFGYSVGISESYAIVGASQEKGTGTSNEGKAYIYSTATGGLLHTLNNPNPSSNDYFGWSASISESYAIVGAYGESGFAGKAYIYDTATGTLLHTLSNPNADPTAGNDTFGISVSITDTHAIVGAPSEDDGGALSSTGKAYVFSTSTGTLLYTLDNPTPTSNDLFGYSVAISDSYAAVGAYLDTINGYTYIYDLSTGSLLHSVVSPFNTGAFGAQFGYSVSITDDYTVVGAPGNGVVAQQSGRAYIYDTATGGLLHTLENPNAFNTSFNDKFGYSVAVSDTCIVIGAYFEDDALPGNNAGKVYVFGDIAANERSVITNLNTSTPVTLASTGIGYYKFEGTNALVVPAGDTASRPSSPEVGDTRWNTDEQYLECFDGSVYIISIGPGDVLSVPDVEDLNTIYSLMLG